MTTGADGGVDPVPPSDDARRCNPAGRGPPSSVSGGGLWRGRQARPFSICLAPSFSYFSSSPYPISTPRKWGPIPSAPQSQSYPTPPSSSSSSPLMGPAVLRDGVELCNIGWGGGAGPVKVSSMSGGHRQWGGPRSSPIGVGDFLLKKLCVETQTMVSKISLMLHCPTHIFHLLRITRMGISIG